jgi:hypothetical protein
MPWSLSGAPCLIRCKTAEMPLEPVAREVLRHNPRNEVTVNVERVTDGQGRTLVRKELRRPVAGAEPGSWSASLDPRAWNYWRREVDAYTSPELREGLLGAGLDLPRCEVEDTAEGAVLWLEDVEGVPGTEFALTDHVALAARVGRWQAVGPFTAPWTSTGFLRAYSTSRAASYQLVEDDAAWRHPLVADLWPATLRDGWRRLLAHRDQLLDVLERLPRTRSHLDLWVSNEFRRADGTVVLVDWAFAGDGAYGEDLGNHVPDAVFDLFWPAERLHELEDACFRAYVEGLQAAGWNGPLREVRLGFLASAVKYAWLLPRMLELAGAESQTAYQQAADAGHLYQQRGLALQRLVDWCDEALTLL